MFYFIVHRLITGFFLVLILLLICIWMVRIIPGSYKDLLMTEEYQLSGELSTDLQKPPLFYFTIFPIKKPDQELNSIWPQFEWNGTSNEFHQHVKSYAGFHFGKSLTDGVAVQEKVIKALPWSLIIQIPAIFLILISSIYFAFKKIQYPDSTLLKIIDKILIWIHSTPGFWLATILLLLFANPDFLAWFPSGMQGVSSSNPWLLWFTNPQYLILPLLCLVLPSLAYLVRLIKNGLEESIGKLYWKRALSSGLSIHQALYKEALPLALIPLIAWLAGILPALISGALIIEYIFSIPGLGRLMYLSISMRDWPVVQFLFVLASVLTILGFLISDILLRYADPRIQGDK